jgi:TonB family protein
MKAQTLRIGLGLIVFAAVLSPRSSFSQDKDRLESTRKVKLREEPQYPPLARRYNIFGKVRVEAIVAPDGSIKKTRELGGSPVLVKAVLDTIQQWKFEAAPKETTEIIEIEFSRENNGDTPGK